MLGQAEEYYAAGVAANQKDWTQAQDNFEKAIETLSSLDVFADGDTTVEAQTYLVLCNIADYKLTLFNLNVMSDDVFPYALDEKFLFLDSLSSFSNDTIVTLPVVQIITYDMPIVLNDRVRSGIIYFQTSARKNFERSLARLTMYIPIMEEVRGRCLPHDLVYLPMIESGFAALAYSYAHAAGFWQFMSYTARDWDLKTTYWHDERYDFENPRTPSPIF